jgi:thiamine-phosphate pyrophosphorylase
MTSAKLGAHSGLRQPLDLSLYLVTDTGQCGRVGVPATVAAAVSAGVTLVQLRDPAASDADLVELGRAVAAELTGTGVPLIVNDRVELVDAIGAQGAHVGQGDLDVRRARARLGRTAYLGLSVQTREQVAAAVSQGIDTVDYLGVGPVWATTSKLDAPPPRGLDEARTIMSASPWPCVAIGGITPARVAPLRALGMAGVAVVSAICGQPDVAVATRALRAAWQDAGAVDAAVDAAAGPAPALEEAGQ